MKKFYSLISFLFLSFSIYSQPLMKWFNPSPDGISLNSIWFVDAGHAWAVGDFGKILFWNGHNWVTQDSKTSEKLQSVYLTDANHGWAVGSNGCILRFENNVWSDQSINPKVNLSCVVIPGAGEGWICGDTILRLVNNVWTVLPGQDTLNLTTMSFTSKNNGWAVNNSRSVFHFDGISWSVNPVSNAGGFFYNLSFSDPEHGIIGSMEMDGFVIYNFNHGSLLPAILTTNIQSVCMIDSTDGYAVGFGGWFYMGDSSGHIYKYENSEWSIDTIVETPLLSIHGNGNLVWATGVSGNIYLKENGKWQLINSPTDQSIAHMSFPDSLHGWMASPKGFIFKYDNGKFLTDTIFPELVIGGIQFTDSLAGFAIADKNINDIGFQFLKYKDKKWTVSTVNYPDFPLAFSVLDANNIWVACYKSMLHFNGTSWQQFSPGISGSQHNEGMCFVNPDLGFAVGYDATGTSFLSKYEGNNWAILKTGLPSYLNRVGTFDGQFLWMSNSYGSIWKYNQLNDSLTLEVPQQNTAFENNMIQIISNSEGYASNKNGIMEYDGIT